ncbi:hypothetical protein GJW-30_1_03915 [Variibacter gotjawalensis]|uniref:Patatin-like phospholipase n=1 Tax=Variibacter gotjawalensis TaxID=1333996 RepID=A0A0S3PZP9_9BRAD|nr:hypothetical protein [Variibacter gotjawalensis]NIK47196.1 hypothetical protein [Variibacter gotjawalensis]RZS49096.1 hypothetical protein EV661_1521 [Variibacter gotjawalensis]BAT61358.1 hypothetical protein GJW-30_1_03915 [Variibacter gotjawalensis]
MQTTTFTLKAGPGARAIIERNGLTPATIGAIGAAAGGPKWLIQGRLDRAIFAEWLREVPAAIPAIGSSIGAFRLACAAQADATAAYERFEAAYLAQTYSARPDAAEITREGRKLIAAILADGGADAVLSSPRLAVNFVVARLKGLTTADSRAAQMLGYGLAFFAHVARPRGLAGHVERYVFSASGEPALSIGADHFHTSWLPLSSANIAEAILASGTLPLIMERIVAIDGAPAGHYVDGGIIDYQMDLAHTDAAKVLFIPHYESRIVPRWFDKSLKWKKPRHTDRMVVLSPSPALIDKLPGKGIPNRKDFKHYAGDDTARLAAWRAAIDASERMAEEFRALVAAGKLEGAVQPL